LVTASLPAQTEEQRVSGDGVDHVVLLVPREDPARFVGPDIRLREIRYTLSNPAGEPVSLHGTMSFGPNSKFEKKLRELLKKSREFELVIYHLVEGNLERLQLEQVKVTRWEKGLVEWTAARVESEVVQENVPTARP
jgi:hypothetical protein